jgi:RNA polymerase sigma factor (sigma-70 family)
VTETAHRAPAPGQPPVRWRLLSDQRLARHATGGDHRAFGEIYRRYHQALYRFCLATTGRPEDAQDALQNTMVKVLRALPGEKREIKLKPWLYRIARNESVEAMRRRHESAELDREQAADAGIAEQAEARERLRILLADLDRLPERQRAALVLRELSGLDFAEIAAVFETSAAVARQTLYEARLSLRQMEAGREMRCAEVMGELSDSDGRATRRRQIRAHLESCADCRAFRDEIAGRRENLAAIAPLPIAASAGLLHSVLGAKAAGGASVGGGLAGPLGAGKVAGTSVLVKSAVTVAVVGAVGVSAANRAHLIDLPLLGTGNGGAAQGAPAGAHSSTAGGGAGAGAGAGGAGPGSGSGSQTARREGDSAAARRANAKRSAEAPGYAGQGDPASSGSRSESEQRPPGGGYGRSASRRHGKPGRRPEAAGQGQQTAASHKPPRAASPPAGGGGSSPHRGQAPASPDSPSSKPSTPAEPAVPAPPKAPPPEPPAGDRSAPPGAAESAPSDPGA